jgi:hypothetical protein
VREVLLTRWEGRDDQLLVYGLLPARVDHGELMGRVRFCLWPTGDDEGAAAASRHVVEAITAGCCAVDIAVSFLRRSSTVSSKAEAFFPSRHCLSLSSPIPANAVRCHSATSTPSQSPVPRHRVRLHLLLPTPTLVVAAMRCH